VTSLGPTAAPPVAGPEWASGTAEPTDYRTSRRYTPAVTLVRPVKISWRIEHGHRELKTGVGLGPFRGPKLTTPPLATADQVFLTWLRPGAQCSRRFDVRLRHSWADPAGGAGHRYPGRPGQHRTQLEVGHLREIVREGREPQSGSMRGSWATTRVPR